MRDPRLRWLKLAGIIKLFATRRAPTPFDAAKGGRVPAPMAAREHATRFSDCQGRGGACRAPPQGSALK